MLHGKVCLVTGAASGMGRATALEMSRQGARAVVVSDVDDAAGEATAARVRELGAEGLYLHCDVSSAAEVSAMMRRVEQDLGVLDVLHNNAGIVDAQVTAARTIYDLSEEVWDRIFDVNVKGMWLTIRHGKDLLARSTAGVVLNCASASSYLHFEGESAYVAAKHAVLGLTRTAATDLARFGIRCLAYAPGVIDTPMNSRIEEASGTGADDLDPLSFNLVRRIGTAEDIARFVCFLASDDAGFITGSCHPIDGGVLAWRGVAS